MATRSDPPHDRVPLSRDEQRVLAELEEVFADTSSEDVPDGPEEPWVLRSRALAACLRWVRLAPWLVPVGIVLTLTTLSSSVVVSAVGLLLTGLGFAACIGRPWARAPVAHLRGWRRRRR